MGKSFRLGVINTIYDNILYYTNLLKQHATNDFYRKKPRIISGSKAFVYEYLHDVPVVISPNVCYFTKCFLPAIRIISAIRNSTMIDRIENELRPVVPFVKA